MSLRPLSQVFQIIFGIPLQYNAPMKHRSLFKALLTGFFHLVNGGAKQA